MFNWFHRTSKSTARRSRSAAIRPQAPHAHDVGVRANTAQAAAVPAPRAALPVGADRLSLGAQRILADLPPTLMPIRSCSHFPQALEKLLIKWRDPIDFRRALDAMLMHSRGDRQGFPFDVVAEFSALREYYDRFVNPVRTKNGWGSISPR